MKIHRRWCVLCKLVAFPSFLSKICAFRKTFTCLGNFLVYIVPFHRFLHRIRSALHLELKCALFMHFEVKCAQINFWALPSINIMFYHFRNSAERYLWINPEHLHFPRYVEIWVESAFCASLSEMCPFWIKSANFDF